MSSPLDSMTALSSAVYFHQPPNDSTSSRRNDSSPKLVLLLGWVAARDAHLAKYIDEYRQICPAACILLVKAELAVMASAYVARRNIAEAIPVIREIVGEAESSNPETRKNPQLLVHLFSNGGSCMLSTLYDVYAEKSSTSLPQTKSMLDRGSAFRVLPLHITIFDSTPSLQYSHSKIVASVMAGIPRGALQIVACPVIQLLSLFWLVSIHVFRKRDEMAYWASSHNDTSKVHEVRRVYVYSNADKMVAYGDVEAHARCAEHRGFSTTLEHFSGSPHVAHAKSDTERYWRIVKEAWSERLKAKAPSPRI
ncbi:hypothetical protein M409DRAFT_61587 [Zasmidium cellare ATCC 36951]|uniref:DUF829 domain protein n=1 Tax=Zasmidium cellare ATCC 36951 TaxID=1080233 RepID=A0A6A6BYN2_ZASCE|nr:uncharacterized protein M409DRAFT_61587 [Zasmidium cellare ATCC 36951]KAF2158516.1 hypothetical protein M409DRAFT_61587 [Zasmidium cellare ATCC 36951]